MSDSMASFRAEASIGTSGRSSPDALEEVGGGAGALCATAMVALPSASTSAREMPLRNLRFRYFFIRLPSDSHYGRCDGRSGILLAEEHNVGLRSLLYLETLRWGAAVSR